MVHSTYLPVHPIRLSFDTMEITSEGNNQFDFLLFRCQNNPQRQCNKAAISVAMFRPDSTATKKLLLEVE